MPFRRGRDGSAPHSQCAYCNRIMKGRHRNTNPGRKVFYHDEHGAYATEEEARAAGLDPDQSSAYGHGTDASWDMEHSYGHTVCPACRARVHREHVEYRRQRQAERMAEAEAEAEAEAAPDDSGSDGEE